MPPTPPRAILTLSAALSAVLLLSALYRIGQATLGAQPNWFLLAFECIVVVSAIIAYFISRADRPGFREGPALGLACVAGAVFVCSVLGSVAKLASQDLRVLLADPFTLARAGIAAAFGALAALTVFVRRPRTSARALVIGGVLLGAALVVPVAWFIPPVRDAASALNPIVLTIGIVLVGLVLTALVSAGVHCVIAAFEAGRDTTPDPARPQA